MCRLEGVTAANGTARRERDDILYLETCWPARRSGHVQALEAIGGHRIRQFRTSGDRRWCGIELIPICVNKKRNTFSAPKHLWTISSPRHDQERRHALNTAK
jgi:hypothetical protein